MEKTALKIALLIGVSEYKPGLNNLPAAVKDIAAMQRVLQDPEMGGFDQVKLLANPDPQAMQYEIETLFSGRSKDDLVLLFFSGHGIKDDSGRLYFATQITRKNDKGDLIRATAVPTSFVHDIMNTSRCKRQAIILDCCFSGAFDPALQAKDGGSVDLRSQLGAEGRVVLASSSSTEYSFEQQGSDLSLYTRYLVEGIETGAGDRNEDGFVSALELHEYAASKVQETAPKMTPKIITLKDKGFEIVLSKARVTDPKLRYRKAASRYANAGSIRPAGRAYLNSLREQLGLSAEETTAIETEVLRPYQERLKNLQNYREALVAEAEYEYPLSEEACEEMNRLRELWGLRDEDILPIQQGVEAQFFHKSAVYQQHLTEYGQAFADAIQQGFPFNPQVRQDLETLQGALALKPEDASQIEQPLLQQAELKHQEQLRQVAEEAQRQQEQAKYENKLRRYEQEFTKAIQADYPLNQSALDGLKTFQQELKLKDEDVDRIEQPIREPAEATYQEQLQQQEQAEQQRQTELEQERQAAEYEQKLQRYEQELTRAIHSEFPLSKPVCERLNTLKFNLELTNEDVQPIIERRAAEYKQQQLERRQQEQLKQEAVEKQRQAEAQERQRQEAEELKRQQRGAERLRQEVLERQSVLEQQQRELASEKGINYTKLRDLLQAGKWKEADHETYLRMLEAVGREDGDWIRIKELQAFPCADLQTIDRLWVKYSNGHFGFSVQKKIWQECGSPTAFDKDLDRFCVKVGWQNAAATAYVEYSQPKLEYSQLKFDTRKSLVGELPARLNYRGDIGCWLIGLISSLPLRLVECNR